MSKLVQNLGGDIFTYYLPWLCAMKYYFKFETMTSYRMKRKVPNQERTLLERSRLVSEYPSAHEIVTHETLTERTMESSPAYQMEEDVITTNNSVQRVAPDTLSVIYDSIAIDRESADVGTEAFSASLLPRNEVIPRYDTPGQISFGPPSVTYDYIDGNEISHDISLQDCPAYESRQLL